jgi:hypothetical protein
MGCSVIAKGLPSLGFSDRVLALMQGYQDFYQRFDADFKLMWHNSHFSNAADRRFYEALAG